MAASCEEFFKKTKVPDNFEEKTTTLQDFVRKHKQIGTKLVLVSSGGTAVPLESRTVRYIDNFSIGTRGSASAEYFLSHGYAVLFLHRRGSLEPFARHFVHGSFLDMLEFPINQSLSTVQVKEMYQPQLRRILDAFTKTRDENRLLKIDFTSLGEYLHLLRASAHALNEMNQRAMLYLAAAVSDFYIPRDEMPEHKIQSANGPLQLALHLVPKMLTPLVKHWCPTAFITSFKLETNKDLLIPKSQDALSNYHHQVVIANILETRKREVVVVTVDSIETVSIDDDEHSAGVEIESKIVQNLIQRHTVWCSG